MRDGVTGSAMVSQCANPDCKRKLRYLRDGKIYLFDLHTVTGGTRLEYFWLCGECSKTMILACVGHAEVKTSARIKLRKKRSQT